MSYLDKILINFWRKRDKRMDSYPMMSTPIPTICLVIIYNLICIKLGPMFMKNKKPYELRRVIVIFNIIMVFFNAYICYQSWVLAIGNDYDWFCQPLDRTNDKRSLKIAHIIWLYYIWKFIDWIDSFFFILRKKFSHVSALHIYHHSLMSTFSWMAARFMPGGLVVWLPFLNCGVHVVMHTYYALSALGPRYHKYLWWKKYLSQLQIGQFVVFIIIGVPACFIYDCKIDLPIESAYFFTIAAFIFLYMFYNFYIETYCKNEQKNIAKAKAF